jgi:release factor glutamine methyltransferase
LERVGVGNPRGVAEQLLAHRLGQPRTEMLLEPAPLTEETRTRFLADAALCAAGMPMQYVMGSACFYGREFAVGPGVLIPRPETEALVAAVLARFDDRPRKVLDVGTGSGAIAVTLALERPSWTVTGVERSQAALAFARRNASAHQAAVQWLRGDLLRGLPSESMDGIVANLPYLDSALSGDWPRELSWEPLLAQDGGPAGL